MTGVVVVAVVVGLVGLGAALSYNRFVSQRHLIANSWSNVDTELQRRHELIPNLVATVSGYAAHERRTIEAVVAARTAAVGGGGSGAAEQARQENVLGDAVRQLLALQEAYPDLQADEAFAQLQHELVVTEDRIQAARRLYNANVRDYNRRVEAIPSTFVARAGGFARADYFEVEPAVRLTPEVGLP
jgi:LemA protein